ncbi:hypothetical protein [Streptomyces cadmiisoli]|uniref:Uncharacterized protein n=1 Tax=Streptomyces cadmiisoli TaxID=2184053 RepID=A0A2Z4JD70_9ACTN|nr:hypothetical protein [Streptomyces cadmiisoli]AWW43055.1 hypothetical protein DN051_41225 [Streptomyces cadmiisoli]
MKSSVPASTRLAVAAPAAVVGVFAVAGGAPLATRLTQLLSGYLFGNFFYGAALGRLALLALGFAALAFAAHHGLASLRTAPTDARER